MKNFSQYLKYPSDIMTFAIIFVVVSAYGLYKGKESLVSFILSLYVGMVAYTSSDFLRSLIFFKQNNTQIFFSKAIVYLIAVILINLVISKIIGIGFAMSKVRNWFEIAGLSIAATASFIVIAFNILSLSGAYSPGLISVKILASGLALFWTLVGSLVIVFFTTR